MWGESGVFVKDFKESDGVEKGAHDYTCGHMS